MKSYLRKYARGVTNKKCDYSLYKNDQYTLICHRPGGDLKKRISAQDRSIFLFLLRSGEAQTKNVSWFSMYNDIDGRISSILYCYVLMKDLRDHEVGNYYHDYMDNAIELK